MERQTQKGIGEVSMMKNIFGYGFGVIGLGAMFATFVTGRLEYSFVITMILLMWVMSDRGVTRA